MSFEQVIRRYEDDCQHVWARSVVGLYNAPARLENKPFFTHYETTLHREPLHRAQSSRCIYVPHNLLTVIFSSERRINLPETQNVVLGFMNLIEGAHPRYTATTLGYGNDSIQTWPYPRN
jgi:hypothetical protein